MSTSKFCAVFIFSARCDSFIFRSWRARTSFFASEANSHLIQSYSQVSKRSLSLPSCFSSKNIDDTFGPCSTLILSNWWGLVTFNKVKESFHLRWGHVINVEQLGTIGYVLDIRCTYNPGCGRGRISRILRWSIERSSPWFFGSKLKWHLAWYAGSPASVLSQHFKWGKICNIAMLHKLNATR